MWMNNGHILKKKLIRFDVCFNDDDDFFSVAKKKINENFLVDYDDGDGLYQILY